MNSLIMRKKHLRTDTSKLAQIRPTEAGDEPLGLTASQEQSADPAASGADDMRHAPREPDRSSRRVMVDRPVLKNFRLDGADIERLHGIVASVNRLSAKGSVSENSVLRSLILLGSRASATDVFGAVKEVLLSRL